MSTDSIEHKIITNYIYYQCTNGLSVLLHTNAPQLPFLPNVQIWKPILLQFSLFLSCPNVTAPRTPDFNIIFIFFNFCISSALFYNFFFLAFNFLFCFFQSILFANFHRASFSLFNLSIPYLNFLPFLYLIYPLLFNELRRFLLHPDYAKINLP